MTKKPLTEAELQAIEERFNNRHHGIHGPDEFECHTVQDIRSLLAELERQRAEVERWKREEAKWRDVALGTGMELRAKHDECDVLKTGIAELRSELAKLRAVAEVGLKVCNWLDAEFERGTFPLATEFRDALAALEVEHADGE